MDNSILALDPGVAEAPAPQLKNATPDPLEEGQAFGDVLDHQLQQEQPQTAAAVKLPDNETQTTGKLPDTGAQATAESPDTVAQAVRMAFVAAQSDQALGNPPLIADTNSAVNSTAASVNGLQIQVPAGAQTSAAAAPVALSAMLRPPPVPGVVQGAGLADPGVIVKADTTGAPAVTLQSQWPGAQANTGANAVAPESMQTVVSEPSTSALPLMPAQASSPARRESTSSTRLQGSAANAVRIPAASRTEAVHAVADGGRSVRSVPQAMAIEHATVESLSQSVATTVTSSPSSSPGIALPAQPISMPAAAANGVSVVTQPLPVLEHSIGDGQWNNAFGQRIVWALDQGVQSASLALNPKELGPVTIQIAVADDVAKLNFYAAHGITREAIETAMPRLREMLQSSGIDLGEVTVSGHSDPRAEHNGAQQRDNESAADSNRQGAQQPAPVSPVVQYTSRGLVDTFV